jgi:hypothetical protein
MKPQSVPHTCVMSQVLVKWRMPDSKLANHKTINKWIELQIMFAWLGVKQGGNWVADFMPDSKLVNLQTQKIAAVLLRVWSLHTSLVYQLELFTKSNCPRYRVDQPIIDGLLMTEHLFISSSYVLHFERFKMIW